MDSLKKLFIYLLLLYCLLLFIDLNCYIARGTYLALNFIKTCEFSEILKKFFTQIFKVSASKFIEKFNELANFYDRWYAPRTMW